MQLSASDFRKTQQAAAVPGWQAWQNAASGGEVPPQPRLKLPRERQGCLTTVQTAASDPVISSICPIDDAFVILCARGRVRAEVENESLVLASPSKPRAHLGQNCCSRCGSGTSSLNRVGRITLKMQLVINCNSSVPI